jgi:hypothetical protein
MKREFPLFVTTVVGIFMILSFFVPHQQVAFRPTSSSNAIIIVAFGYVLGGANTLKLNADSIYKRQPGWTYKAGAGAGADRHRGDRRRRGP